MISSGINLVMAVIGFAVSTMFIVFVCTRLICARIQLNASRRSFLVASRSDLSILERGLLISVPRNPYMYLLVLLKVLLIWLHRLNDAGMPSIRAIYASGKKRVEYILPSHIVTLVKMSGILTMLDALTGSKLQESDPAYSLPILERVQQLQGHIFIVESKSSVKTEVSSRHNIESSGAHGAEPILEDEYKKFDVSRLRGV